MFVGRTAIGLAFYKGKLTTYSWESNSDALRWWHWSNKGWRQGWDWCRRYRQWQSVLSTSHSYESEQVLRNITRLIISRWWPGVSHKQVWMEESNLLASPMYKTWYFVRCFPKKIMIALSIKFTNFRKIEWRWETLSFQYLTCSTGCSPLHWEVLGTSCNQRMCCEKRNLSRTHGIWVV